jgi:O-antigen/teichoic acid export membrane protein
MINSKYTPEAILKYFISFFSKGHQRTIEAKRNIASSFIIKCFSIAISLVMVPITIHYVNPTQYGIWLTLSSMVAWISFFNIGFTQGLRNRFAEAKAKADFKLAKIYISTVYYYISIIFMSLWLILIVINIFINWSKIININATSTSEISYLVFIILSYFCFQFIFKIINTILIADQKPAKAAMLDLLGQIFSLLSVYLLTKLTKGSLVNLSLALGIAPTLIVIIANVYFFKTKYKYFSPSLKFVKHEYAKDIMNLGLKFFVVQIAATIQYQTVLFLIAHYFDMLQVTSYNIAFKYFSILQMGFMILLSPLWSATTDAYASSDVEWIKKAVNRYLYLFLAIIVLGFIMLAFAQPIYNLWIGKGIVNIRFTISLLCFMTVISTTFGSIFVHVINGIGAIKIQFYSSLITPIIFIILSMVFIKFFHLGVESILIASIASNLFGIFIAPIQYYQLIYHKKRGSIWTQ